MNDEQYLHRLSVLKKGYKNAEDMLAREYVDSNAIASGGDIIEDNCSIIVVEKTLYNTAFCSVPSISYYGNRLTQKYEPYKSGEHHYINQHCITKINGKPIKKGEQ